MELTFTNNNYIKYSDPIQKDGLAEEINRICQTTAAVYSNYDKVARVNAALDRYLFLSKNRLHPLDDHDNAAAPRETQNLVSGTNTYAFTSFTSEVYELLNLEIKDSSGNGRALIPETIDALNMQVISNASGQISNVISGSFEELYTQAVSGTPTHYTKLGNYIYLRPNPSYSSTGGLIALFTRPLTKYTFTTFTVTIASPGVFSATAHGLAANDALIFETDGALPTGLTADTIVYYVISTGLTADAFRVSTTIGGSAVNTSGSQSGNHKFLKVNKEPGIISTHHPFLARHASLPYLIEKKLVQMPLVAQQILQDEREIMDFFTIRNRDIQPRLVPMWEDNK